MSFALDLQLTLNNSSNEQSIEIIIDMLPVNLIHSNSSFVLTNRYFIFPLVNHFLDFLLQLSPSTFRYIIMFINIL